MLSPLHLMRSGKAEQNTPQGKSCDIYGPPLLCKVIINNDRIGLSCGHIVGLRGKYSDFPALMESAHARLNTIQTSKRPCRNAGSENAGLTPGAITSFSPSQLSVSVSHTWHSRRNSSCPLKPASAYAALRYSASLVNSAQAIRAFLVAIAPAAIFFPRRCSTLMSQRLRASVLRRARGTVARAP